MPSWLLYTEPMTIGWTFARVFNCPLSVVTFAPCMMAWRKPLVQAPPRLHPSSPPQVALSQTEANRWRGSQNTTRSSTQGRTLLLTQLSRVPALCISWKSLTFHPQWRNWARPLTPLLATKLQVKMAFQQKSSRLASRLPSSTTSMSFCYGAEKRGLCPKICMMQTSSPYTRTSVTAVTATITMESPSSALLGRPSPTWGWTGCRYLLCLPRSTVWIQGWQIDNQHDLLTTSAPREVPQAKAISVYHVYQPDQGFWLGQ